MSNKTGCSGNNSRKSYIGTLLIFFFGWGSLTLITKLTLYLCLVPVPWYEVLIFQSVKLWKLFFPKLICWRIEILYGWQFFLDFARTKFCKFLQIPIFLDLGENKILRILEFLCQFPEIIPTKSFSPENLTSQQLRYLRYLMRCT